MFSKKKTITSTETYSEKIARAKECVENADHLFQKNGFDKARLFYTQGDYGLFQCSLPCHNQTYDNKELIFEMVKNQKNFKIPTELVPLCPKCGKPMTTNLRKDNGFVEDDGWHKAMDRYSNFD